MSKFDIHILFSKSLPVTISNVTSDKCSASAPVYDTELRSAVESWSAVNNDVFRLNLVSGGAGVAGSGQGVSISTQYSGQLVGDSGQCSSSTTTLSGPDETSSDQLTVGLSCCNTPGTLINN